MAAIGPLSFGELLNSPALPAPPGLTTNLTNPSDLETEFYINIVLCFTISFLAVCMRIWTKARLIQKFEREDWVCLLAFVIFSGYCAHMFYTVKLGGVGVHQWNILHKSLPKYLYHTRVGIVFYGSVVFTIKLAILIEFLRIFSPGRSDITFWIYHILIWLNFLFYAIVVFLLIFPCQPIEKFWKPWIGGRCMNVPTILIAIVSFNSVSNLSILVVPQNVIWNLQMSFKKKVGVSAIFLVGVFACFASLIGVYYSIRLSKSEDITYHVGILGLWSLPEMASGLLAICLTVSPRFFQSLKYTTIPSWISISRPRLGRSSKTAGYLAQFQSPIHLPKRSSLLRAKQASLPRNRSVGLTSGKAAPADGYPLPKLEPGNSHILRCVEISTTFEPIDTSTPVYPPDR